VTTIEPFVDIPGLRDRPRLEGGLWRLRAPVAGLVPAMRSLLIDRGGTLLTIAGEDRLAADAIAVHYVVAMPDVPWVVVHVEVLLERSQPDLPSLAGLSFPASRFERELRDLLGVRIPDHPDPRPLVRHAFWPDTFHPLRADAEIPSFEDDGQPFPFTEVAGEGVFEIPVGPVHAGVIEPGHFRFNVLGETILEMRARLFFTHKGTERLFQGKTPDEGIALAERVSGDTSVAHAVAYCQAVEQLAGIEIPESAAAARTIVLELERLYNHVGDVGAIIGDTGFAVGQQHCLRIREGLLRVNKQVAGHRLLRGVVVPGGVAAIAATGATAREVRRLVADFEDVVGISLENTLVQDRLDDTGRLPADIARDYGVVGYVARARGIARDVRVDLPFAAYGRLGMTPVVEQKGDVNARLRVRVGEGRLAADLIERALELPVSDGPARSPLGRLTAALPAVGIVEGWRGRVVHVVIADDRGHLGRVKIVDPSFFNWPALAPALAGNIVPDFPLCNKSFNQSYSGNDL
jgi:Ni,Fe-hydrogenase III large subunit/Ni,Fe-hydrogenase III component G